MNRSSLAILLAACGLARLNAQGITPLPMLRSVAEAETEGRAFPRGPAAIDSIRVPMFANATRGTAERRCVDLTRDTVRNMDPKAPSVRFGDFSVNGNVGATEAGQKYKMWWNQLHHVENGTPMVVRSTRIDAAATPADTSRYFEERPVYPAYRLSPDEAARTGRTFTSPPIPYYMTSWGVPTVGTWLVVATAANDWGCMVIRAQPFRPRG
jgi:hypothetical protein